MDFDTPVYSIQNARLQFGERPLFTGLNLYVKKGDKACLVGRNGSGKSTLLKVMAGLIEPDTAEVFLQPGTLVSYMAQDDALDEYDTLRDVVLSGLGDHRFDEAYKADVLISDLSIKGEQKTKTASGGERKKAALAKALISEPDILLLDEPTNHLDISTIEKLEDIIRNFSGAVIVVSHDKAFLKRVGTSMIWLDRGIARMSDKGFEYFEDWQDAVFEQEEAEQRRLAKKIEAETEWLHKGVTARRKRNQGRLRRLFDLRTQRREQLKQTGSVDLNIEEGALRSKLIIEAKHLNKSFGERTIVKDFSIRIMQGNKIGIVGANGAGKTTLLKLLTQRLEPDSGMSRRARMIEEVYFDQHRESLDPDATLKETLCPDGGDHILVQNEYKHVYSYLKDFLFKPSEANAPVSSLSGGEKNRLLLAKVLAKPSNFLVLDEPTNDLDTDTLDLLQEALVNYKGTLLIVSHDRDFLDNVATSLLYMAGDGSVVEYVDSCTDMLEKIRKKEAEALKKNAKTAVTEKKETAKPKAQTRRMSYKDKRLLETLPHEIEVLEAEIKIVESKMEDPEFYARSPDEFQREAERLSTLKADLDVKETQWLELNMLAEELGI